MPLEVVVCTNEDIDLSNPITFETLEILNLTKSSTMAEFPSLGTGRDDLVWNASTNTYKYYLFNETGMPDSMLNLKNYCFRALTNCEYNVTT
jgi:hypothetical protein